MAQITAKSGDGKPVTVEFDIPAKLADKVKKFGEDVINAHANGSLTIAVQGYIRNMLKAGKSAKEIAAAVAEYKPGMRTPGKSAMEKLKERFSKLSPEERKRMIKELG